MPHASDYSLLDDPAELAEVARELPPSRVGARRMETVVTIDGVHCAACVVAIESALRDSVESVTVNAATRRARLVFTPDTQALSGLFRRIAALGYQPRPVSQGAIGLAEAAGRRRSLWRMLVATLCMMQVMMYATPRYVAGEGDMPADIVQLLIWAEWVLTLPVMVFAAGPFFVNAWRDLRARRIGMDVPVALGIAVTFIASSVAASTGGGEVWFDSVSMFVAFLLVGRWLEAAARERALAGVADLLARLPETVERLDPGGAATPVTLRQLLPGDRIRVAVGQTVPADGTVCAGRSHADESLLTGESRPVPKQPGDAVSAGSINLDGPIELTVTRAVRHSRMQEIIDLIDAASARKPRLAQLADRWAGPFLVAVLLLAALAFTVWRFIDPARAIWVAASVLVVACPCALSLATPTALLAAAGRLARIGLLARSPAAIESLAQVDTLVFDKTGTLTLDRMSVAQIDLGPAAARFGLDETAALRLAVALEAGSLHPLAGALRRALEQTAPGLSGDGHQAPRDEPERVEPLTELDSVREHPGAGVAGRLSLGERSVEARVGSPTFAGRLADSVADSVVDNRADGGAPGAEGRHPVVLALDGEAVAGFQITETLRPDAARALQMLREDGLAIEILSGDHPARVAALADALGVSRWRGQASPQDKLDRIVDLQGEGHQVAMVGDGINDAPVLARAQVSVAFATGAALAQHQADLLILGDRLSGLTEARRLSVQAMKVVRQNLVFALAYNVLAIPLALVGWLPAWLAGIGMAASSLVVVLNALRLAPAPRRRPAVHPGLVPVSPAQPL